ncbi:TetR/AcrR family transcriptional regulator [Kitasatospora sp. NPDC050467]|uniref:TetR/AcrR family transcriptional regulator n=1 Tax=unclassified Kitasatospora TaxID=2633591 RepID=UPI0037A6E95F
MSIETATATGEAPERRRDRKARRTRESLAAAALRLVLERGLAAVSVEDITDLADVSPRTFSRYFPSREDAVLDCLRADFARIDAALAARPAASRAWVRHPAAGAAAPDLPDLLDQAFDVLAAEPVPDGRAAPLPGPASVGPQEERGRSGGPGDGEGLRPADGWRAARGAVSSLS